MTGITVTSECARAPSNYTRTHTTKLSKTVVPVVLSIVKAVKH